MQKVGRCLECGAYRILRQDMCKRCHADSFMAASGQVAAKFWGPIFFAIASLYIPSYIYNVINGAPLGPKLVDLSLSALFFGLGAAVYFRRVDHKPKKKGRVPEAIKEAASKLLKRPVAEPSAA